jgi:pilus assembly protein CpaF
MNQLDTISDEVVLNLIETHVYQELISQPLEVKDQMIRQLFNTIRKLGFIQNFLDDNAITEIMINGYQNILIEKNGIIIKSDTCFESSEDYDQVIQKIVGIMDRKVNEKYPICDVRLKDGSRVNIVLQPIGIDGPYMTIRKFPKEKVDSKKYC